jgi:hypothetical protein
VAGVDTSLDHQWGPATGATEGPGKTTIPRTITMVAYDSEGVRSAPLTENVPLTPASNPTIDFCIADLGHSPCVNTPANGGQAPFPVTVGDTLRVKPTGASGGDDPISYYAIAVGPPNTANVKNPVGKGKVSDCTFPSQVGSWTLPGAQAPPASTTTGPTGGNASGSAGGTIIGAKAPASGPSAHAAAARATVRAAASVRGHDTAAGPIAVPPFSDLEAGAFAPHDCQAYADRTVDAGGPAGPVPTSGPNTVLKQHAARIVAPGAGPVSGVPAATTPTHLYAAPTVANPVLVTTPGHNLDFTFSNPGTYSVAIAAYTSAGLGAITRIDGFVAEPKRQGGRCETVDSESLNFDAPSTHTVTRHSHRLAFSGNCITVVSDGGHPDLYVSPGTMDISGVPITRQVGDSIVINANLNKLYVTNCPVPESDLNQPTFKHNPCPEPSASNAGRLYLGLGSGKDGQPGLAFVPNFSAKQANETFTPLTEGALGQVGSAPKQSNTLVSGCGLYPGSQPWQMASSALYDQFHVATEPCVSFSTDGSSRVAYWDYLPNGFGDGASQTDPTSQIVLYGKDVPAAT